MESRRLSIPIYLNQRVVFDLLAISQGGFSQLQTIRSSASDSSSAKKDASVDIGTKNVFAFLNMGVNASVNKQNVSVSQTETEEDRVYTPTSLFSKLRDGLIEKKLLHCLDKPFDIDALSPGNFVEFSGILRKNPLVGYMEGMIQMMETAMLFMDKQQKPKKQETGTLTQMKKFLSTLQQAGTLDLVANLISSPDIQSVIPVQLEYFSNESPADIIDGQFVVLGKIVRYIESEDDDSVSLLRGTPLAYLPIEHLSELTQAFQQVGSIISPSDEFTARISGPVLLVIPIAIYA